MSRCLAWFSHLLGPIALAIAATSCATDPGGVDTSPPDSRLIRFIHFNDLHAHLVPHSTLVADQNGQARIAEQGGLARLATVIRGLRAEVPDSVLMNIGDTYHGGVEALYTQGEAIAAPVNALGIDIGVPGNWDFAFGPIVTRVRYLGTPLSGLQECIEMGSSQGGAGGGGGGSIPELTPPTFPNLAANITFKTGPGANPGDPFLPPTALLDVGGVQVGFIGISSDIVPRMHPMLACGLTFLGADHLASGDAAAWDAAYEALVARHATALRQAGAVVVVVMSELGLQKDFHLANLLAPGTVDVVFSAHTHETVFEPLVSASGALVVEAGDDTYVGTMDVRLVDGAVTERRWRLQPVTADIAEDPEMAALVAAAREPFLRQDPNLAIPGATGAQLLLREPITKVIGTAPNPLDRKNALDSTFNDFFTEALRTRAGTQLGMAPGFRFDAPIATDESLVEGDIVADGSVTLEDAYRFFPVVYAMGVADTTGEHLRDVLERALDAVFSTTIPLQNGGWVEGFAGFSATVDLTATSGARVQSIELRDRTPLRDRDTYSIAGCRRPFDPEGVLCSHAGFTNVRDLTKPGGQVWTNVEILRDGLERARMLTPTRVLTDLSNTPLWPAAPYVQPLTGAGP